MNIDRFRYALLLALAVCWSWLQFTGAFTAETWVDEVTTQYRVAGYGASWPWAAGPLSASEIQDDISEAGTFAEVLDALDQSGIHPPLYYMVRTALSPIISNKILAARLLSIVFAALSVVVVWRLAVLLRVPDVGRYLKGPDASAAVFAFASIPFAMAHDGRYYTFTYLLITLLVYLTTKVWRSDTLRVRDYCLAGLVCGALAATQYLAAPLGGAALLFLVIIAFMRAEGGLPALKLVACMAVFFLPLAVFGALTLHAQLEAGGRPDQLAGFDGVILQTLKAIQSLAKVALAEPVDLWLGRAQTMILLASLVGSVLCLRVRTMRFPVLLLLGFVAIQLLGMIGFGFALDKRLAQSVRYNSLLMPVLAPLFIFALYGWASWVKRTGLYPLVVGAFLLLQIGRAMIGNTIDGWPRQAQTEKNLVVSHLLENRDMAAPLYIDDAAWNNFSIGEFLRLMNVEGVETPVASVGNYQGEEHYLMLRQTLYPTETVLSGCSRVAQEEPIELLSCRPPAEGS